MNAPATVTLSWEYLDKYLSKAAAFQVAAWQAANFLRFGNTEKAMGYLREALEEHDPKGARILWPITPPALSNEEMADLIAEDEAADRREAVWEASKELAARNGGLV